MEELKNRILQDGKVINNEILKVDSFINHQIDVELLNNISSFLASHFENVNKILTIETSGIAFAIGVAQQLGNIPVVFAKKSKSALTDNNVYSAEVKSFTRKINSTVIVDKRFLKEGENILFVDDFLAEGNAALGLLDICNQAKCNVGFISSDPSWFKAIKVHGTRTSASDEAIQTLQSKGYTISVNP